MLNIACANTCTAFSAWPRCPIASVCVREPLGLVEVAGELRLRAAEQRRPPLVQRPVQRRRQPRGGGDLDVGAGDVAQLEQVDDRPAGALELELRIADRLGQAAQLGRDLEPLLHGLGPPERVVARVQAGRERHRVAEPARERDRLGGEREPPVGIARVVELEREPGEQPRAQRRVLAAERPERLLQQPGDVLLHAPELRPAAGVAERRAAEQRRVAERASAARGRGERRRGARPTPARSCDAPSASSSSQRRRSSSAPGQLARTQRGAVVPGRLLPGEQAVRAAARREREVDRALGPVDRRGEREVVRELAQVRVELGAAERDQRLAHAAVQARAAQRGQPVVERRAHQRVAERVAPDALGDLDQHAGGDRLLERGHELVPRQRADLLEHVEVELAPDHRRRREHLPRGLAEHAPAGAT